MRLTVLVEIFLLKRGIDVDSHELGSEAWIERWRRYQRKPRRAATLAIGGHERRRPRELEGNLLIAPDSRGEDERDLVVAAFQDLSGAWRHAEADKITGHARERLAGEKFRHPGVMQQQADQRLARYLALYAVGEDCRGFGDERSRVARAATVADGAVGFEGKEAVPERGLRRARAAEMGNIGLDAGAEPGPRRE
jgi:hypothetical protein